MNKEDTEILDLLKSSNSFEQGFNKLVSKYKQPLYWHIRRMVLIHEDADDILQNVFIKVYKSIGKFKRQSKLFTWLYRIASNESISFLNKKRSLQNYSANLRSSLKADPYFNGDNIQLALKEAIEELPKKQKQVFILRYYDELNYKDMAEILDTSVGSLKASYHHASKKIEEYLIQMDVKV